MVRFEFMINFSAGNCVEKSLLLPPYSLLLCLCGGWLLYSTWTKIAFSITNMLDQTQNHDFPTTKRAIGGGLLSGVGRRCFREVLRTSLASTEIRGAATDSIGESRRCRRSFGGPIVSRSKRRMTLEGLISNFLAGWDVGVGVDYTVKATAVKRCNLGFGGSTNWMLWQRRTKWMTCEHGRPTRQLTMVDRGVERTSAKFGP